MLASATAAATASKMPRVQEISVLLSQLHETTLDLGHMSDQRFRFVHIDPLARNEALEVVSFDDLSEVEHRYAALSYPWDGLKLDVPSSGSSVINFNVKGAELGGVINCDVLKTCCRAAERLVPNDHKHPYLLWVDRLCIKQEDKYDKNWQIRYMHDIYRRCALCLVLPGGLRRLAGLQEPTTWAQRAWTLQEALVPRRVECLVSWKRQGVKTAWMNLPPVVVEPFHSAAMSLSALVNAVMTGIHFTLMELGDENFQYGRLAVEDARDETDKEKSGAGGKQAVSAASREVVLNVEPGGVARNEEVKIMTYTEAHVLFDVLSHQESELRDRKEAALWKCALLRTSSRPVDMVFSVMALFGVALEPSSFAVDDRDAATLALTQKIMENGGRAMWLGLSFTMAPSIFMSTMPAFPETTVATQATVETPSGRRNVQEMIDTMWLLADGLSGTVDDDAYLHTRSRARAIQKDDGSSPSGQVISEAEINGQAEKWVVQPGSDPDGKYYAVAIGERSPSSPGGAGTYMFSDSAVLMIVQRHHEKPSRYDRRSFATVTPAFIANWPQLDLCIGGPAVRVRGMINRATR